MNRYEREVVTANYEAEAAVMRELERVYRQALLNIERRIVELSTREATTSVMYQLNFQVRMQQELSQMVRMLNDRTISCLNTYLQNAYEMNWKGAFYEMNRAGIPVVSPIDPQAMLAAINIHVQGVTFAQRVGINHLQFQREISDILFQSLADNSLLGETSRRIRQRFNMGYKEAFRIARTEGRRIQSKARLTAMQEAERQGAIIKKEWHSALSDTTRDWHAEIHGQLRAVGEDFVNSRGNAAPHPLGFGIAEEDINCKCIILQRAEWGLTEEDRQQRAKELSDYMNKDKNFTEYQEFFDVEVGEEDQGRLLLS